MACALCRIYAIALLCALVRADSYGTFSDDDIAGLRSEASQREITRSNPRFIEEHEKPFHLPWFTKIMICIAVLGFITVGTLLLTAFFSGHLGMMSVTRGGRIALRAPRAPLRTALVRSHVDVDAPRAPPLFPRAVAAIVSRIGRRREPMRGHGARDARDGMRKYARAHARTRARTHARTGAHSLGKPCETVGHLGGSRSVH